MNNTEIIAKTADILGKGVALLAKTAVNIGKTSINYVKEQRRRREYDKYVAERIEAKDPNFIVTYEEYQESISGQNDW